MCLLQAKKLMYIGKSIWQPIAKSTHLVCLEARLSSAKCFVTFCTKLIVEKESTVCHFSFPRILNYWSFKEVGGGGM